MAITFRRNVIIFEYHFDSVTSVYRVWSTGHENCTFPLVNVLPEILDLETPLLLGKPALFCCCNGFAVWCDLCSDSANVGTTWYVYRASLFHTSDQDTRKLFQRGPNAYVSHYLVYCLIVVIPHHDECNTSDTSDYCLEFSISSLAEKRWSIYGFKTWKKALPRVEHSKFRKIWQAATWMVIFWCLWPKSFRPQKRTSLIDLFETEFVVRLTSRWNFFEFVVVWFLNYYLPSCSQNTPSLMATICCCVGEVDTTKSEAWDNWDRKCSGLPQEEDR